MAARAGRPPRHRADRAADHRRQAAPLPGTDLRRDHRRCRRRPGPDPHRQHPRVRPRRADVLRHRLRSDDGERRHADRPRRHVRQAARRLRRRRPDRRHDRRPRLTACAAVGDGPGRRDHRPADVLRDRPGPADAGDLPGRPAQPALPDQHRHPGAGRALRDARPGAAAPRSADGDREPARRPGHDSRVRCPRGRADRGRLRSAVRQAGRPLGRRTRSGAVRRRRADRRDEAPELRDHHVQRAAAGRPDARQGPRGHLDRGQHPTRCGWSSTSSARRSWP